MKLINSKVELIQQPKGLLGVYKQIELCGRTCYKSEDNITHDSCTRFVNAMVKNKHTAMLEHGTVYLTVPVASDDDLTALGIYYKYKINPYSKVVYHDNNYYITTNYRVIVENSWDDDLKYMSEPSFHIKRYCFRITCNRIQSQSICRHRHFSFAQESTRYCNYSKDKFNHEICFVLPELYTKNESYEELLKNAEQTYFKLIEQGWKAESARDVLPNALKTEICVTGFEDDWKHFLDLRYRETTGKAHPDMKAIATKISKILEENE